MNFTFLPSTLSPAADLFIGTYLSASFLLSLILNPVVMVTITGRLKRGGEPLDAYVLSLVSHELLQTVMGFMPVILSCFTHGWGFSQAWCYYQAGVVYFCGLVTIWTLTVLSVARFLKTFAASYLAIYCRRFSIQGVIICSIVIVWIHALLWVSIPFFFDGGYSIESFHLSCSINFTAMPTYYLVGLVSFNFILPVAIQVLSYISMCVKLRRSVSKKVAAGTRRKRMDTYFAKIAFLMCLCFLLAWTPYAIACIFYTSGNGEMLPDILVVGAPILAKSAVWFHPIIYFLMIKRLRHDVIRYGFMCGCALLKENNYIEIVCSTDNSLGRIGVTRLSKLELKSAKEAEIEALPVCEKTEIQETHL